MKPEDEYEPTEEELAEYWDDQRDEDEHGYADTVAAGLERRMR